MVGQHQGTGPGSGGGMEDVRKPRPDVGGKGPDSPALFSCSSPAEP